MRIVNKMSQMFSSLNEILLEEGTQKNKGFYSQNNRENVIDNGSNTNNNKNNSKWTSQ